MSKYDGTLEPAKLKCLHCGIDWSVKRLSETLYVYKGCTRCSKRYNGAYSKKLFKIKPSLKNSIGNTYFVKCVDKKESFYNLRDFQRTNKILPEKKVRELFFQGHPRY